MSRKRKAKNDSSQPSSTVEPHSAANAPDGTMTGSTPAAGEGLPQSVPPVDAPLTKSVNPQAIQPTPSTDEVATAPKQDRKLEIIPDLDAMKRHGLTLKQERFSQAYLTSGGNATEAARKAGYTDGATRQVAHHTLTSDNVRERIQELCQSAGLDLKKMAQNALGNLSKHVQAPKGADMRWASDRILELSGLTGRQQAAKNEINVGIVGIDPANMDKLTDAIVKKVSEMPTQSNNTAHNIDCGDTSSGPDQSGRVT